MNPVFKEYNNYLKFHGLDLDLTEGYYWVDRQIIKYFNNNGEVQKLLRIKTKDDLSLEFSFYKNKMQEVESWEDTYKRYSQKLFEKENKSIKLIKNSINKDTLNIMLTSTGKDSQIVKFLLDKAGCEYLTMFNNTSMDCADTYKMIKKETSAIITNPKIGFYKWVIEQNNIPSRINRTCCDLFKEGRTVEYLIEKGFKDKNILFFLGMRNEESNNRSAYGDKWKNIKWMEKWDGLLPIREWTEIDVWLYTLHNNIEINEKYKKGYGRVGCAITCPFYNKSTWALDKYFYNKGYNRWQSILEEDFIRNAKWTRMNCTVAEYLKEWNGGSVREAPTEETINEFCKIKGISYELALKYFDNNCDICNKKITGRDLTSMNMKLNGRNTTRFYCKKHLKQVHNIKSEKEWRALLQSFRDLKCSLF